MSLKITLTNESESITLEKTSRSENYYLSNKDGQGIWLTEDEMREIKYLISDMLNHVHQNDYN